MGWYQSPKLGGDYRGGTIGASPAYSFTAHVAEVECDPETGFVDVRKIWIAHDCGRALNPVAVEGQMEGSAYMGFAEALHGGAVVQSRGACITVRVCITDRRCSTTASRRRSTRPSCESIIVESVDPEGPYGAKEAGEGPLHPSIPAIANAIYDALGIRCDRLPFQSAARARDAAAPATRAPMGAGAAQIRGGAPVGTTDPATRKR